MMRYWQPFLVSLFLFFISDSIVAQESLADTPKKWRSPEGQVALKDLHASLIKGFKSKHVEKRYLAAHKLSQLSDDELTPELLDAAIESAHIPNWNYRWHIAHLMKKISGENNGINIEAWRGWLRERYRPVVRKVGPGASKLKSQREVPELSSGSWGHDNSGGVSAADVAPSDQLGHDPNFKINKPAQNTLNITKIQGEGWGEIKGKALDDWVEQSEKSKPSAPAPIEDQANLPSSQESPPDYQPQAPTDP